jgi:hypothetical protein
MAQAVRFFSLRRGARLLALACLAAMASPLQAQTPATPARSPQLAAAQTSFESLSEAERKAIQTDLIWTGHLNSAASGGFGPLTFQAINAFKGGRGPADGVLAPTERRALAQQGGAARAATGFRIVGDPRTGARLGVPVAVLPRTEALPSGGSRWQSADGRITLDVSASPPGDDLAQIFERATAPTPNNPGRRITYRLLRPDFFVVTGETPTGKFYRRLAAGPEGLRGFSIGYDKALSPTVDRLVIAIASSFEPFPTGPAPAAPAATPGSAIGSLGGMSPPLPAVPARPTERYGVGLALSDRAVLTASSALDGCRTLRAGGRIARLRSKDDASGLAVLDLDGGAGASASGLRAEPLADKENVVLLAFGDDGGKRAALALPGSGARIGQNAAVFAPLQPGQAGSPVFDRQGRWVGLVTASPSDKALVAGVAPQRAYAIVDGAALQGFLGKAGVPVAAAAAGGDLSTGAVVEKAGKAALPVVCGL